MVIWVDLVFSLSVTVICVDLFSFVDKQINYNKIFWREHIIDKKTFYQIYKLSKELNYLQDYNNERSFLYNLKYYSDSFRNISRESDICMYINAFQLRVYL